MSVHRLELEQKLRERETELRREGEPQRDIELTLADDCALLLEAWFKARQLRGRVLLLDSEVRSLAAKLRALGRRAG